MVCCLKLNPSHLCAEFVGVADSGPAEGLAATEVRVRTAGRRWYLRVVTTVVGDVSEEVAFMVLMVLMTLKLAPVGDGDSLLLV